MNTPPITLDASAVERRLLPRIGGQFSMPETGSPVFFRSVGLGLEDIAIAHAIYRGACTEK